MKLLVILVGLVSLCEAERSSEKPWPDPETNKYKDHPNFKHLDQPRCGHEPIWEISKDLPGLLTFLYPWTVLLTEKDSTGDGMVYCGGSLISDRAILTSAKCVTAKDKNKLEVKLHHKPIEPNRNVFLHSFEPNAFNVVKHSDYNEVTQENDIALIILNEPLNPFYPICLPFSDELIKKDLTDSVISGFGVTENGLLTMMFASPAYYPHESCKEFYNITEKQMCTFDEMHVYTCDGDEGDPLQASEGEQYFLYGITSYLYKPCGKYPTVYTKVTEYLEWILDNVAPSENVKESEEDLNKV